MRWAISGRRLARLSLLEGSLLLFRFLTRNFFVLGDIACPFAYEELLFLPGRRFRIQIGLQKAVLLKQSRRDGSERDIVLQAVEDCFFRQIVVRDQLSVIGRIFCDPALEFEHQTWITMKDGHNLAHSRGDALHVLAGQFRLRHDWLLPSLG